MVYTGSAAPKEDALPIALSGTVFGPEEKVNLKKDTRQFKCVKFVMIFCRSFFFILKTTTFGRLRVSAHGISFITNSFFGTHHSPIIPVLPDKANVFGDTYMCP